MKEKKLTINYLPINDIRSLLISYIYEHHKGKQTHLAKYLGISPSCVNEFCAGRSDRINWKITSALNEYFAALVNQKKITKNTLVYYTLE